MTAPGQNRAAAGKSPRLARSQPGDIPTRTRRAGENERTETVNESTLDRLTKLAAQRSARLDSLREACLTLCELIAPLRTPEGSRYIISTYHQRSNVGGCEWTMIRRTGAGCLDDYADAAPEEWTIDRPCNASGGWTHGDFHSPQPSGPTPRQLRDFAAWLADPATLAAIADLEQETAATVDGLTAKLNAAAVALKD